jgi:hypothetical protein
LIDSVYQHVIVWRQALAGMGIDLSVWRVHRRIGMSGGLFVSALPRETGLKLTREQIDELRIAHMEAYEQQATPVRPGSRPACWACRTTRRWSPPAGCVAPGRTGPVPCRGGAGPRGSGACHGGG